MGKYILFFRLLAVLLSTALNSVLAQNKDLEVGSNLVLTPSSSGRIKNILWKHEANLAAEWLNNELEFYGMFRNRTTLDTTTGQLEIKNITESYSGMYTVEINNKLQSQGYNVQVFKRLSKPEVVQRPLSCSTASDSCIMSCDGDSSGAGPVTYSWKKDDGQWVEEGKDKTIINNEETKRVKTFSCQMKNPVSVEESDPHQNPFFQEEPPSSPVGGVIGGVFVFLALAVAGGLAYWKRESIRKLLTRGSNQAASAPKNGSVQDSTPGEGQALTSVESKDPPPSDS